MLLKARLMARGIIKENDQGPQAHCQLAGGLLVCNISQRR